MFKFKPVCEFGSIFPDNKTKFGRYHRSVWHHKQPGYYVICVYIEGDINELLKTYSKEQIMDMVIEQFNKPIYKKYRGKTKEIYPYGKLKKYQHWFKNNYIEALLLTNDNNNENFWGEGVNYE